LPTPTTCTYPNVGTTIIDFRGDPAFSTGNEMGFAQICSTTLIRLDEQKAVFVSAAHCAPPVSDPFPKWITFEPQPSIAFASGNFGRFTRTPIRPFSNTQHLLPVAAHVRHPLFQTPGGGEIADQLLYFVDVTTLPTNELSYLQQITPMKVPMTLNYLDSFSNSQLHNASYNGVGYDRLESTALCDPENPLCPQGPSLKVSDHTRIPARHNRTYGELNYTSMSNKVIKLHNKLSQEQNGICSGDSGSVLIFTDPLTQENVAIGTLAVFSGVVCTQDWYGYARFDAPDGFKFIHCGIDKNSDGSTRTINQALECINQAF
jgi:hypothetical protein